MFQHLLQETIFLVHIVREIFHWIEMKAQRDIDLLDIALTLAATEKGSFETYGIIVTWDTFLGSIKRLKMCFNISKFQKNNLVDAYLERDIPLKEIKIDLLDIALTLAATEKGPFETLYIYGIIVTVVQWTINAKQ